MEIARNRPFEAKFVVWETLLYRKRVEKDNQHGLSGGSAQPPTEIMEKPV